MIFDKYRVRQRYPIFFLTTVYFKFSYFFHHRIDFSFLKYISWISYTLLNSINMLIFNFLDIHDINQIINIKLNRKWILFLNIIEFNKYILILIFIKYWYKTKIYAKYWIFLWGFKIIPTTLLLDYYSFITCLYYFISFISFIF